MLQSTPQSPALTVLTNVPMEGYRLLDSGIGQKLEQFGPYRFIRPESQAIWRPALPEREWDRADAVFEGAEEGESRWIFRRKIEQRWMMEYKSLKFWVKPTPFRHLGVFPEQSDHWEWASRLIKQAGRPVNVLNLFAYTGVFTLIAANAGANVTHVDASKTMITWANENQALSGMKDQPIRWIVDDALKFVRREERRGVQYDGIILDPPKFGRGPKGEVWKLFETLPEMLHLCRAILSDKPLFVILTAYALRLSAVSLYYVLEELMREYRGQVTAGEVALIEQSANRVLSQAIFARWGAEG